MRAPGVAVLAFAVLAAAGCQGGPPLPGVDEPVPGQYQRLIKVAQAPLFDEVATALADDGFEIERKDSQHGVLVTAPVRHTGRGNLAAELREIADLAVAARRGLRHVSEYYVRYQLLLTPAGPRETVLRITTEIDAVDRGRGLLIGPGLFQVIPTRYRVPSRGVAERRLMREIARRIYTAEEMLYYLGELGAD